MMDRILSKLRDSVRGVRVRSALNPLLWLVGLLVFGVIAIVNIANHLPYNYEWLLAGMFALLSLVVSTALGCYVYLLQKDPDKLRSGYIAPAEMNPIPGRTTTSIEPHEEA